MNAGGVGLALLVALLGVWPPPSLGQVAPDRGAVSGVVLDPDGRPVAGAALEIMWRIWGPPGPEGQPPPGNFGGRTPLVTGPGGEFAIEDLDAGRISLGAQVPGMMGCYSEVFQVDPGQRVTGVVLKSAGWGGTVIGTVLDEEGRPVEGAVVTLSVGLGHGDVTRALAELKPGPTVTQTDADGWFQFGRLTPGEHSLCVYFPRHPPATRTGVRVGEGDEVAVELTLARCLPGTWTLVGTLRDAAGAPVERASMVVLWPPSERLYRLSATPYSTGDVGEFVLYDLPPDVPLPISVFDPQRGFWETTVQGTAGEYRVIEPTIDPGTVLVGRVLDADGLPIADQDLSVSASPEQTAGQRARGRSGTVHSDPLGAYHFAGLAPGQWKLRVRLAGQPTYESDAFVIPAATPEWEHDIRFPPAARIAGVVTDAEGQPIADALLDISPCPAGMPATGQPRRASAAGRFRLGPLDPGVYTIGVLAPGFFPTTTRIEVAEGQSVEDTRIVMGQGATISGVVCEETGAPRAGVGVHVDATPYYSRRDECPWLRALGLGNSPIAVTDDEGRFTLRGVTADELWLTASLDQSRGSVVRDALPDEDEAARVTPLPVRNRQTDGRFAEAGGVLIRDADQSDLEGVRIVMARWVEDEDLCTVAGRIRASSPDQLPKERPFVTLEREPARREWLLSPHHPYPRSTDSADVDAEGRFGIRNVAPGAYYLVLVDRDTYVPFAEATLEPGEQVDLGEFHIPAPGSLQGLVTDAQGHPVTTGYVAAARVADNLPYFSSEPPRGPGGLVFTPIGPDGRYRLESLGGGYWFVVPGGEALDAAVRRRVYIDGGVTQDLPQTCRGAIRGRVTDPQGKPLPGVGVSCTGLALNGGRWAVSDATGLYVLKDLPTGTYTVVAGGGDDPALLRTTISGVSVAEGGPPTVLNMTVRPGIVIRGRLVAAPEAAGKLDIGRFDLEVRAGRKRVAGVSISHGGSFRTIPLPPGTYTVKCLSRRGEALIAESEPVTLAEGQVVEDVVIELPAEKAP